MRGDGGVEMLMAGKRVVRGGMVTVISLVSMDLKLGVLIILRVFVGKAMFLLEGGRGRDMSEGYLLMRLRVVV